MRTRAALCAITAAVAASGAIVGCSRGPSAAPTVNTPEAVVADGIAKLEAGAIEEYVTECLDPVKVGRLRQGEGPRLRAYVKEHAGEFLSVLRAVRAVQPRYDPVGGSAALRAQDAVVSCVRVGNRWYIQDVQRSPAATTSGPALRR